MTNNSPAVLRSAFYALRGGFLIRPFLIAFLVGTAGAVLSAIEERYPAIQTVVPWTLFPSHADPQVAQAILTTIATATMTVVSIVFAILLMTLTLASTQFSPQILISFVRDQVTQWTLGIFLGTFSYCIAALPAARLLPSPFVPVVTVVGAMALAPICVGWLIYFIHHTSIAINVNTIIDRIRRETEFVIDELMPYPRRAVNMAERDGPLLRISTALSSAGPRVISDMSTSFAFAHLQKPMGSVSGLNAVWAISLPKGSLSSKRRGAIASRRIERPNCWRPSISVQREPCSKTWNSGSSRLSISLCAPCRQRSMTQQRRSVASIS